jgi:hypothetical protein
VRGADEVEHIRTPQTVQNVHLTVARAVVWGPHMQEREREILVYLIMFRLEGARGRTA